MLHPESDRNHQTLKGISVYIPSDSISLSATGKNFFASNRIPMNRFISLWCLLFVIPLAFSQEDSDESEISITGDSVQLDEFVAEDSLLRQVETAANSRSVPIQIIGEDQIATAGFTTVEEFFQNLPINGGGSVPMQNNQVGYTPGASSISLRGLGAGSTLILINGKRLAPYPYGDHGVGAFVDLNSIPASSIERVEILEDSGTALYGADAVGGVINIITRKDYEGAELVLRYGNDTSSTDSGEFYSALTFGINDPQGNVSGNLYYLKKNSIHNADRSYSAKPPFLSSNAIPMNIQISAEAARDALGLGPLDLIPGLDEEGYPSPQDRLVLATIGPSFRDGSRIPSANVGGIDDGLYPTNYTYLGGWGSHSRYNFNRLAQATPRIERMGAYLNFNRRIFGSEHYTLQGDASFTRAEAYNTLAPTATGNFRDLGSGHGTAYGGHSHEESGVSIVIPGTTAFPINRPDVYHHHEDDEHDEVLAGYVIHAGQDGLRDTEDDIYRLEEVAPGAFNRFNPFNQDIEGSSRIRLEEFGLRTMESITDAFYTTWTLEGRDLEIAGDTWNYDFGFRYSLVDSATESHFVSKTLLNRILNENDPWFDPASPEYLGTEMPYNPFGASQIDGYSNENNQKIAENAKVQLKDNARSDLLVGFFEAVSDDIYNLPGGDIAVRFGYDWRREEVDQNNDPRRINGDVAGTGSTTSTSAHRYIHGGYLDTWIPILSPEMKTFLYSWDVSLTARMDHFITSERTSLVPKISSRVMPFRQVALRGSWGLNYREPSLFELYSGINRGLHSLTNPWNPDDQNPEITVSHGGNPFLKPVDSETYNLGIVYTPDFLKGATLSLDYWVITRDNEVIEDPQDTVNRIFRDPNLAIPGEAVHRDAQDNLLLVETLFLNGAYNQTRGLDLAASYVHPTQTSGTFSWLLDFTWLIEDRVQFSPSRPVFDYVGYGTSTQFDVREPQPRDLPLGNEEGETLVITNIGYNTDAYLEYRFTTTFAWSYRYFDIAMLGRYTSGFADIGPAFNLTRVDDRLLWDLQTSYTFLPDEKRWFGNTTLTFGVENLFDTDPPSAFAFYNNYIGYPGHLYEPDGQRYYVSLKKTF